MFRCVSFLLITVTLAWGASLKPAAKEIATAASNLFTAVNIRKSILEVACQNEDAANVLRSLDPITPKCYDCIFTNLRKFVIQIEEKQISESDVPKLLSVACKDHLQEMVKLQAAATAIAAPGATIATNAYKDLTPGVKNVLALIQKLGEDSKSNPDLQKDRALYCSRIADITAAVRNLNDADRASIVKVYSPASDYISTTGQHYDEFNNYLSLVDTRCNGNITKEEKTQFMELGLKYNLVLRDNLVPYLNSLRERIEGVTVDPTCLQDKVLVRVAGRIGNATAKDASARLKSNQVKTALNQFIVKSNELKKASASKSA